MENKKLTGVELIAEERKRQIEKVGWTRQHDQDEHWNGELAIAAKCYETPRAERKYRIEDGPYTHRIPESWPWDDKWWKPEPTNRVRELVKAGALYVAENERLGENKWGEKIDEIAAEIDRLQTTQPNEDARQ